jgi:hypothetical protein
VGVGDWARMMPMIVRGGVKFQLWRIAVTRVLAVAM